MSNIKIYQRYLGLLLGLSVATLISAGCGGGGKDELADVPTQAEFVGATNCEQCHTATFDDWLDTPHAVAFVNLDPADQSDPECLACHNTTQNSLEGVQCEACHGPGGLHRGLGPIGLSYQDSNCQRCHDNDADDSASHSETYSQWVVSGHADELAAAWHEFSNEAPPPGRHKSTYPIEMSNSSDGNFRCFQCHNGIGALSYIKDIILTPAAITVEENATAECATCHNPHQEAAAKVVDPGPPLQAVTTTKHVRLPEALSFNTSLASVNRVFTFLDGSDIPETIGNSIICVFCHQGRSSGLVLNTNKFGLVANSKDRKFENDHYLAAGAILWGRNGYEYTNRSYTRDFAHNNLANGNCTGCHMSNSNTAIVTDDPVFWAGGHTWEMVSDAGVENVKACNVSGCHGTPGVADPVTDFRTFNANDADYDGNGFVDGAAEEIGGFDLNPDTGAPLDGLLGALTAVIEDRGFLYNPNRYPYFFKTDGSSTTPSDWTNENLAAAFNLNMVFKTVKQFSPLPAGGFEGGTNIHNPPYTVQILVDSLQSLDNADDVLGPVRVTTIVANRPQEGTDPARDYGANQLSLP